MADGESRNNSGQNFAPPSRHAWLPHGDCFLSESPPPDCRHTTVTPAIGLFQEFDENMYHKSGKVKSGVQFFLFLSLVENRSASEVGWSVGMEGETADGG